MCLGDLGVVTGFVPERAGRDVVVVDTVRGTVEASILLAPHTRRGDHVVVHSGHVLQVIDAARAGEAALLRQGSGEAALPRQGADTNTPDRPS